MEAEKKPLSGGAQAAETLTSVALLFSKMPPKEVIE
jgi:hypothetical protein